MLFNCAAEMTLDKLALGLVAWPKTVVNCRDLSFEIRVLALREKRSLFAAAAMLMTINEWT
jgi:hypothetical protein